MSNPLTDTITDCHCLSSQKPPTSEVTCEQCGKSLTSKTNLSRHLVTHNGPYQHECATCGLVFASKNSLRKHVVRALAWARSKGKSLVTPLVVNPLTDTLTDCPCPSSQMASTNELTCQHCAKELHNQDKPVAPPGQAQRHVRARVLRMGQSVRPQGHSPAALARA